MVGSISGIAWLAESVQQQQVAGAIVQDDID